MKTRFSLLKRLPAALACATLLSAPLYAIAESSKETLAPVSSFNKITSKDRRSKAIFVEMGKVIMHPRCLNCHPVDPSPRQGMEMRLHEPPVVRGPDNFGPEGMKCDTCHSDQNVKVMAQTDDIKSIPGHPKWHLAPPEMAWVGKSLKEICEQIKDEKRNGGMSMKEMEHHMAEDTLVGWGWNPGEGREPVPGTQKQFGELFKAWVKTGAVCPE